MSSTAIRTDVQVHALGPLRVTRDGAEVRLGGPRQRRLLAVLLIHLGSVASVDRIAEAVFAGEPTDAAATTLRSYVARLRRVLGEDAVLTRAPGYQLTLPLEAFDATAFETATQHSRSALQRQDPAAAAELARGALDLWQGEAYAEFADEEWAHQESQRLAELRLTARELLAEAELACGHTADVLPDLEALRTEHPLREGIRGLLMTAYYRAGRQADALAEFRGFRAELADELGIDPSPALVELERRILAQDPGLSPPGEPLRGYRLGERLGTGREGTVHVAHLPGVDRELVVKTLRAEVADEPGFIRAFEATAHRVASLEHPAVLPIHDYWREPGAAYVVMRRVCGGTLRDRLRQGPLGPPELRVLVERIGGALLAASDAGLAHGRITPDNVLYDGQEPVLADFWLGGAAAPEPDGDVRALAALVRASAAPDGNSLDDALRARSLSDLVLGLLEALGEDAPDVGADTNPYQGLQAFDEADADNYFGRTELIDDVFGRLAAGVRLILLVGASGTGKSSAVRAGLLPRLRAAHRSSEWFVATMLPAGAPYTELAAALNRIAVAPTTGLAERMTAGGDDGIDAALRDVVPEGGQLLLVVDQFEELFTLSPEPEQRAFLGALTRAITAPDSRLRMVATLRADFYDRPLAVQPFGSLVGEATVAIPAMLPAEVEAAVVEPARRAGRSVERALAAELVSAVATEPAALPSLQFVLFELAERSPDGNLTMAGYHDLGGLDGAIAARAEELYQSLDDADRTHVRELFERLVVVGEGEPTRRRATRDEVGSADALVDAWAAARLLTIDVHPQTRVPTVEVAHEALVREWPRLREWIEADRSELVVLARVRESARAWEELDRDRAALLRGTALEAAVEVTSRRMALPPLELEFVEESRLAAEAERLHQVMLIRRQGRTNRRLRWQLGGIGVLLVLALVGGFVALDQGRQASDARRSAIARELAAAAAASLEDDPERSILLALSSIETSRQAGDPVLMEATDALHRAVSSNRVVHSIEGTGGDLALSPDGKYLVTEGPEESGLVELRDQATGSVLRTWKAEAVDINAVTFSPDSRVLATNGDEGVLRLWQVPDGRLLNSYRLEAPGREPAFTADSRSVLAGGVPVRVLPVRGKTPGPRNLGFYGNGLVAASPQGHVAAIPFDLDDTVQLQVAGGPRHTLVVGAGPTDVAFSPDGRWLAVATGAVAQLYDVRSGALRLESSGHTGAVNAVAWSPDSRLLATGSSDGTVQVHEVMPSGLPELLELAAQDLRNGVQDVAFTGDGGRLYASDFNLTAVKVFDVRRHGGAEVAGIPGRTGQHTSDAFARDGRSAWLVGEDGLPARFDVRTGGRIQSLPAEDPELERSLHASPDGELVVELRAELPHVVWRVGSGDVAFEIDEWAWPYAWSSDGRHLAMRLETEQGPALRVVDRGGREVARIPLDPRLRFEGLGFAAGDTLVVLTHANERFEPDSRGLQVWDWRAPRLVRDIKADAWPLATAAHDRVVTAHLFAGTAEVWDVRTGKRVVRLVGHSARISAADWSRDGDRVATAADDGTVRVWRADTGELLSTLLAPGGVAPMSVGFSPDGRRLLATYADGVVRVWTLDVDELVAIAQRRVTRQLTDPECQQYLHMDSCQE